MKYLIVLFDCELVLNGNTGTLKMTRNLVTVLEDTLFDVHVENFKYSGRVHGRFDTTRFEFYDFTGDVKSCYGLEPDNGIYRIRHFVLKRS